MGGTWTSASIKQKIKEDKAKGMPCEQIMKKYNVSKSYVNTVDKDVLKWQSDFRKEWANIYPGDEVREKRKTA